MNRVVAYQRNNRPHEFRQFMGETKTLSIDLSKLESELGESISSCVWKVEHGNASVANESLVSSKAQSDITTTRSGRALIKVTCNGSSQSHVVYVYIKINEPGGFSGDYC